MINPNQTTIKRIFHRFQRMSMLILVCLLLCLVPLKGAAQTASAGVIAPVSTGGITADAQDDLANSVAVEDMEKPVFPENESSRGLNISGTKTFEMKQAEIKGDIGHFSTENFDSIPGFHLDQSLHLEVDGNISNNTKVNAVLDDKDDEERRFTVHIDGRIWDFTLGDFPLEMPDTELMLFNKEVRGVMAVGDLHENWKTMFLYSGSKGMARREQFRGAGQQQEFRLSGSPVVQNSEQVRIDGKLLVRGTDYYIDYEDGVIKLQPQLLPIEVTSWIVAEYEVSDAKLAFKRNLMGSRFMYVRPGKGRLAVTLLQESDDSTPKSETTASGTVRPMEHRLVGFDGEWQLNQTFTFKGEQVFSEYDPNRISEAAPEDRVLSDSAHRYVLLAQTEKWDGELARRSIGSDYKMIGREEGVTELGERGLVRDILKETGKLNYRLNDRWSLFGGLEKSETNRSRDPEYSAIDYFQSRGGATWKYAPKSQFESRFEWEKDKEFKEIVLSNRDKAVQTMVWDHELGKYFLQSKLEKTTYDDSVNVASGSSVSQAWVGFGSDANKKLIWNISGSKLYLDDDLDVHKLRGETDNVAVDLNYDPSREFNARGIVQWRREQDHFCQTQQTDEIADTRVQYRPNPDLRTQFKYKIENTTKVVRDPNLDPTKYIQPTSLPLSQTEEDEVIGRYENPVQKRTGNISTNYRLGEKIETNLDWKRRDLKDRLKGEILSLNDRKTYELRFTPAQKWKFSTEFENGLARTVSPDTELQDTVKRFSLVNEFREGYILESRYENRWEDDIYLQDNDRETTAKSVDFQRVFSRSATMEVGIQRNIIAYRQPSKDWEKRAAFIFTPQARNQRYKFFFNHKSIEAEKSGSHYEGGVNFSQVIGTDTMIDGEVKRVKATAGVSGEGYEGMVANAKMVITF
jgi:hypothetical protein